MLFRVFWILCSLLAPFVGFSQTLDWLNTTSGGGDHVLYSTSVDPSTSETYVVGSFKNDILTSNGANITADAAEQVSITSHGEDDVYLAKYTQSGELMWSVTGGSDKQDEFLSIAVLPDGSVLAGGYISLGATLDINGESTSIPTSDSSNSKRALIAHFSPDGELLDYVLHDLSVGSAVIDIAVDALGYSILYQKGNSAYTANGVFYASNRQFFIERRDFSHNIQWINGIGGSGNAVAEEFSILHARLDAVNGETALHCPFEQDVQSVTKYDAEGNYISSSNYSLALDLGLGTVDCLVALFDSSGDLIWIDSVVQSASIIEGMDIALNCDGVYVCGTAGGNIFGSVYFPGGTTKTAWSKSVFIAKLDKASGSTVWADIIESENGSDTEGAYALALGPNGNVYCGGYVEEALDFTDWSSSVTGDKGGFVFCYSPDGVFEWSQSIEGTRDVIVYDLTITDDQLYICGLGSDYMNDGPVESDSNNNGLHAQFSIPLPGAPPCCVFGNAGPLSVNVNLSCGALEAKFLYPFNPVTDFVLQYSSDGISFSDVTAFGMNDEFTLVGANVGFYRLVTTTADCGEFSSEVVEVVAPIESSLESPGAVSCNLNFWLRADKLAFNNGTEFAVDEEGILTEWRDLASDYTLQSRDANHLENDINRPIRKSSTFNNHPVVDFDGNDNMVIAEKAVFGNEEGLHFWTVLRTDTTLITKRKLISVGGALELGYGIDVDRDSVGVWTPDGEYNRAAHNHFGRPFLLEVAFETIEGTYVIVDGIDTVFHSSAPVPVLDEDMILFNQDLNLDSDDGGPFVIGMPSNTYDENQGFIGQIAEVIAYEGIVSEEDAMRIRSYLALRYGITFHHPPTEPYVGSEGNTLLDFSGALANMNNGVFGIGADNDSYFYQEQAKSSEVSEPLRIQKVDAGIGEDAYLVLGHNGKSVRPIKTYLGQDSIRMERYWGISENVDLGAIRCLLPDNPDNPFTTMLLSTDSLFTNVYESICLTEYNGYLTAEFDAIHETFLSFSTAPFTLESTISNVSCNGASDGSIELIVAGNGPFNFEWEELGLSGEEFYELADLTAGTHTVTISDLSGCTLTFEFNIEEPTALSINDLNVVPTSCIESSDGQATLEVIGGSPDYSYSLEYDDGENTVTLFSNESVPISGTLELVGLAVGDYTCIFEDQNGCTEQTSFSVASNDTTPPVIACLVSAERSVGADCTYILEDFISAASITETCALLSTTQSPAVGTSLAPGVHTIEISAVDGSGNTGTCSFNLTVVDSTPPNVVCLDDQERSVNAACMYILEDFTTLISETDNCNDLVVTQQPNPSSALSIGVHTITMSIYDYALNFVECSFELTVSDAAPPSLSCIPNQFREVTDGCTYSMEDFTSMVTTSDNCGAPVLAQVPAVGEVLTVGSHVVELSSTDATGNVSVCSFEIEVLDSINPIVDCPGDKVRSANSTCQYILEDFISELVIIESCGIASIVQVPAAGTPLSLGAQNLVFTITDNNGNSSTCSFLLTVEDTTAPLINCLNNVEIELDGDCTYELPDYSVGLSFNENCGIASFTQSIAPGTQLGVGNYSVTIEVVDFSDNATTCVIDISIQDEEQPEFTCIEDQVVEPNSGCNHVIQDYTTLMGITDNCGIATVVQTPYPGNLLSQGNYTVSVSITDVHGNYSGCSFDLTISDLQPPTFSCVPNTTKLVGANCTYTVEDFTGLTSPFDNCSIASIDQIPSIGNELSVGFHLIELVVTDLAGNSSSCTFELEVEDDQAPQLICPPNISVGLTGNCVYVLEDITSNCSVTDNCEINTLYQIPSPGTELGLGTHTVNVFATDLSGNIVNESVEIDVFDDQAPTFSCPENQFVGLNSACTYVLEDFTLDLEVVENCWVGPIAQTPAAGTELGEGDHWITIEVFDTSGLSSTCQFQVFVEDTSEPVITCTSSLTFEATSCFYEIPSLLDQVNVTAECSTYSGTQSIAAGTSLSVGEHEITFEIVDFFGNSTQCSTNITITDTSNPVFNCVPLISVLPNDGCNYTVGSWDGLIEVTDNCSVNVSSDLDGQVLSEGTYNIELTATDAYGNTSVCSTQLEVPILDEPTIVCPQSIEIPFDENCITHVPEGADVVFAAAACGNSEDLIFSQNILPGEPFDSNSNLVVTIEDEFGQTATCSTELIRLDDLAPQIVCPEIIIVELNPDCTVPELELGDLVLVDDCSFTTTTSDFLDLPIDGPDVFELAYLVTDAFGLSASCTSQMHVQDATPPSIECPENQILALDVNCSFEMLDFTGLAISSDACGDVSVTQSPIVGTIFSSPQDITVSLTSIDDSGNQTVCDFNLTLIDQTPPELTCLENQELLFEGCSFELPNFAPENSSDDCGEISFTQSPVPGSQLGPGVHIVEITATDNASNTSACLFELTAVKTDGIQLECLDAMNVTGESCEIVLEDFTQALIVSSACGEVIYSQSPAPGTEVTEGLTVVTLFAEDEYSSDMCTFDFTYSIEPIVDIGCAEDLIVENEIGQCGANVTYQLPQVDVSCGVPELILTQGLAPGSFFELGETLVEFDIEINNEYHSSCQFTITVTDEEAPLIECEEELISCTPIVVFDAPIASDNCNEVELVRTDATGLNSGDTFPIGITILSFLATDEAGNQSTCALEIQVIEPPEPSFDSENVFLCANDATLNLNDYLQTVNGSLSWSGNVSESGVFDPSETGAGLFVVEVEVSLNGCSGADVIEVEVGALPEVNAGEDFEICGLQAVLDASGSAIDWDWEAGENGVVLVQDETLNPTVEGDVYGSINYMLSGVSDQGCSTSDEVLVTFSEPVGDVFLGEDLLLTSNEAITIDSDFNGIGSLDWIWDGPTGLDQLDVEPGIIEVGGFSPGEYELVVVVSNGSCPTKSDSLLILMEERLIPTGFSPNGDNKNETFFIQGASKYNAIKLKVFTRNGMEVFTSDDYKNDWGGISTNGDLLPADTYYILLELDEELYQGYLVIRR